MRQLVEKINKNITLLINNTTYKVKTKTWYTIEEDSTASYVKCELTNDKVLVIIPDDDLVYIGQIIENMHFERTSDNQIIYNGKVFNKTGEGHQYIVNIEFGEEEHVEGNCIFEDYESENNIISLGVLPDQNIRADVYADILSKEDISFR